METPKKYVNTMHIAIVDAVMTLSRSRMRRDGPFWLPRPRSPLSVITQLLDPRDPEPGVGPSTIAATVTCETWEGTTLTLTLTTTGRDLDWLAWGDFVITYGKSAPHPSLVGKTVGKRIAPSFETSVVYLPMRYRIKTRVIR